MNRYNTQEIAKSLLQKDLVVLDTETTGLDESAEIIEVGLIDKHGEVLVNELVIPTRPVPEFITKLTGIDRQDIVTVGNHWKAVAILMTKYKESTFAIFNAVFDIRMIEQTTQVQSWLSLSPELFPDLAFIKSNSVDVMELANRHFYKHLEWDEEQSKFKRLSLAKCCELAGIDHTNGAHRAVNDCQATLKLIEFIAQDEAA